MFGRSLIWPVGKGSVTNLVLNDVKILLSTITKDVSSYQSEYIENVKGSFLLFETYLSFIVCSIIQSENKDENNSKCNCFLSFLLKQNPEATLKRECYTRRRRHPLFWIDLILIFIMLCYQLLNDPKNVVSVRVLGSFFHQSQSFKSYFCARNQGRAVVKRSKSVS